VRAFFAIELPQDVREHLLGVQQMIGDIAPSAARVAGDQLHLTLKFLGEISPDVLDSLNESVEKLHRPGPIPLQAQDLECFPSRGPIRIVGAAIGGDLIPLLALSKAVEQRCQYLGFPTEARGFRPHITLARAKSGLPSSKRAELTIATRPHWPGPTLMVSTFTLFQSILRSSGAEHRAVRTFSIEK
jgi:2'-5' RNA ligase